MFPLKRSLFDFQNSPTDSGGSLLIFQQWIACRLLMNELVTKSNSDLSSFTFAFPKSELWEGEMCGTLENCFSPSFCVSPLYI